MVNFISPPGAPEFHRTLVLELNRAFGSYGEVRHFDSADLPAADRNAMQTVYLDDLNTLALSDGTDWRPVTLGAPI